MKKIQTTIHKNIGTKWKYYQKTAQYQHIPSTFFRRQSGKLTEIGHEPEDLGTRLLYIAICCFQPKNLRS